MPWLEPPFAAPSVPNVLDTPFDQRTSGEVADLFKARFCLALPASKKLKEMRWVTTCLASEHTEKTIPRYSGWEAYAFLYVAVDILTHHDTVVQERSLSTIKTKQERPI